MDLRFLKDSPEYLRRKQSNFSPPSVTFTELRGAIPKELWKKSTTKAAYYVVRDIFCSACFYKAATFIEPSIHAFTNNGILGHVTACLLKYTLWATYWWWQGIALAGWWCLGHEAGHGTLSDHAWINHVVGYSLHTFLLVPYYSWRSTHQAHHKATGSVERDENYVPRTRTDYALPHVMEARVTDYHDIFEETPIYTLGRMLIMQAFGWHAYLAYNALGSPRYPKGTNHLSPTSALFKERERLKIAASNLGLAFTLCMLSLYIRHAGFPSFVKFYFIPYLLANHWIVMLTFLHHSDPTIPHYRSKEWTFIRGAVATVDRPLLGWVGRFFLHNVSHDHVAHHLFSTIPFYNQPQVTAHVKRVLGEHYNYDSTNTFRALYRSFTECCFIEDEGDIVFYKNKDGEVQRRLGLSHDVEEKGIAKDGAI